MTVPNASPEHKPDMERLVRFAPHGSAGVTGMSTVGALVEQFGASHWSQPDRCRPLDLRLTAFLGDLGGSIDAAGFQMLLSALGRSRR